jgi:hypothetical protein
MVLGAKTLAGVIYLGVGESCVGHVRVYRVAAVMVWTGSSSTADGLEVVDAGIVPKRKIVHGTVGETAAYGRRWKGQW